MKHQRRRRPWSTQLVLLSISMLAVLSLAGPAAARLRVVATTTDIAAVFRAVGGDDVEVEAIARGYQDPHYLEAKPSYIVKLRRADALAYVGLELEVGWLPLLIEGARNDELLLGRRGNIPMSVGIEILEIPTGEVSRAEGDIHPLGNPHYALDPRNFVVMAEAAGNELARLDPERSESYAARRVASGRMQSRSVGGPHRAWRGPASCTTTSSGSTWPTGSIWRSWTTWSLGPGSRPVHATCVSWRRP